MPDSGTHGEPPAKRGTDVAAARRRPAGDAASPAVVLWTFTLTTFLSALLLFSIQPMFAKMVLPVLGGAPSVWAVAMFFFQAALLIGYCYAHVLIARVPLVATGVIHLGLCALAFVALPIGLPAGWSEPPAGEPALWQLGLFTAAIGLPFVAIAANAPLLQAWFARTGHPHGGDPYFLYAASNLGSLIALLGYPLMLEPAFGVRSLSRMWTIGFMLLALALAVVFMFARTRNAPLPAADAKHDMSPAGPGNGAPGWADRLAWIALSCVPAALLTAFTTHVTTDIASAPLLWVLPLSLYLLTFVLVFRERPLIPRNVLLLLHLLSVAVALLALSQTFQDNWFVTAATGVVVFFTSAMVAHRTLYEARPSARHLTEFYIWMSFGGALGGLAAALIAPRIFSEVLEYPILLALSIACRPGVIDAAALGRLGTSLKRAVQRRLGRPVNLNGTPLLPEDRRTMAFVAWVVAGGLLAILAISVSGTRFRLPVGDWNLTIFIAAFFGVLMLFELRRPARQLAAALMMCAAVVMLPSAVRQGEAQRSFFGVYRVQTGVDSEFRTLLHGTTLHGAQRVRDSNGKPVADTTPSTYYYPGSPMAQAIATTQARLGKAQGRYGVVGLGAGSLACYKKPGETWRMYEIDPVMVRIARDPRYFSFLSTCQPDADIVVGDARLTLTKEAPGSFDVLIIDAFSSDSVPIHLLTAEALRLYMDKVKPDGLLLLHISNKYLDLDAVVSATVKLLPGVETLLVTDDEADDDSEAESVSTVAVLARSKAALAAMSRLGGAGPLPQTTLRAWTDDYSDIMGPFLSKLRKED